MSGLPVSGTRRWRWPALVLRLVEYGTQAYPPKVRRRLKILNVMACLIAVFSAMFAVTYALEDLWAYRWAVVINLVLVATALCAPLLHRYHEIAAAMLIMVAEYAGLFGLVALLGRSSGIQLNLIGAAAVSFAVLGRERIGLIVTIIALGFALHVAAWFLFPSGLAAMPADGAFLAQLYVNAALSVFAVTAAIAYYAFSLAERAEAETEALLRNVLPDKIVERLKARPDEPVAEAYAEASVLFSDLKSFVPLARALGPARTVEMLNDLVRRFDELAAEHGVEKIKTIGDAYMAVAGLPEPAPDHAARLAAMALEMRSAARKTGARFDVELTLRIGIAAGPVMAGVIGTRKFSYDVWGDPVNLAARLENSCEANCIHVSAETRERLAERFEFRSRGLTEIKGLGRQETFFLVGPREVPEEPREAAA